MAGLLVKDRRLVVRNRRLVVGQCAECCGNTCVQCQCCASGSYISHPTWTPSGAPSPAIVRIEVESAYESLTGPASSELLASVDVPVTVPSCIGFSSSILASLTGTDSNGLPLPSTHAINFSFAPGNLGGFPFAPAGAAWSAFNIRWFTPHNGFGGAGANFYGAARPGQTFWSISAGSPNYNGNEWVTSDTPNRVAGQYVLTSTGNITTLGAGTTGVSLGVTRSHPQFEFIAQVSMRILSPTLAPCPGFAAATCSNCNDNNTGGFVV